MGDRVKLVLVVCWHWQQSQIFLDAIAIFSGKTLDSMDSCHKQSACVGRYLEIITMLTNIIAKEVQVNRYLENCRQSTVLVHLGKSHQLGKEHKCGEPSNVARRRPMILLWDFSIVANAEVSSWKFNSGWEDWLISCIDFVFWIFISILYLYQFCTYCHMPLDVSSRKLKLGWFVNVLYRFSLCFIIYISYILYVFGKYLPHVGSWKLKPGELARAAILTLSIVSPSLPDPLNVYLYTFYIHIVWVYLVFTLNILVHVQIWVFKVEICLQK